MNKRYVAALLIASISAFCSCSSDSGTTDIHPSDDKCESKADCPDGADCIQSVCTTVEEKNCGDQNCLENQKCIEGKCIDLCGSEICGERQRCVENECIDLCGVEICKENESCINDRCVAETLCGEKACTEEEICIDEVCLPKGDCGGIQCNETQYCQLDQCIDKVRCGEIYCDAEFDCVEGTCRPSAVCLDGNPRCGEVCCEESQICGASQLCCERSEACGQDCCTEAEVCEYEMCHKKCEAESVRCQDSDGVEMCCQKGEICVSNRCFAPTVSCIDNYVCEDDQFCDASLKTCIPAPSGDACESYSSGGKVEPTLLWYWGENPPETFPKHVQVMSSPMVADINNDTIPEVVFNSYEDGNATWNGHGILRVVNGQTGELIASSDGNPLTDGGSNVALGNLDDDPYIEIATCSADWKLIVYKFIPADPNTGAKAKLEVFWKSKATYIECYNHGPGIADFNGDGKPEVYGRYTVHDGQTGEIIANKVCVNGSIWAPCDYSVAADVDGDGIQELVGGNVVYKVDFDKKELNEVWHRADMPDGYPALANLDLDKEGKAELVVIQNVPNTNFAGTLMAFDAATGTNFWDKPVAYDIGHGGAPTIANMNDTPQPEIAFAGVGGNMVFDYQGNVLWRRYSHDHSSGVTGSTVFDFDGDGKAEVVYADEYFLRVYDGKTGDTRYCACNTNCTLWEYPVIVDVDADNHAEIIISSNNSCSINSCPTTLGEKDGKDPCVDSIIAKGGTALAGTHGVRAFASPDRDWVNTRKIYNQHAYSITNVSDDASIPKTPKQNWKTRNLNNFRLNVQPGASYLPDLAIKDVSSPYDCDTPIPIYFRVENVGWATADKGITINIWAAKEEDGEYKQVGSVKTTEQLRASNSEYLKFDYDDMAVSGAYLKLTFGEDVPKECRTDNNTTKYYIQCPVN